MSRHGARRSAVEHAGRSAAAPRRDPRLGLTARRKASARTSCSIFNLTSRIARAAGPLEGATVVEIGPGPGGLTRALLIEGAGRVVAIEKDERCLPALARYRRALSGAARDRLRRRQSSRLRQRSASGPCPHRRQSALQRRHAAPRRLAQDRALAAMVRPAGAHVPARGGATHRGQARQQGLRAPRRAEPMAHQAAHPAHPPGRSLHAAAQRSIPPWSSSCRDRRRASLRRRHAREGDGRGVRSAAQDAALIAAANHA